MEHIPQKDEGLSIFPSSSIKLEKKVKGRKEGKELHDSITSEHLKPKTPGFGVIEKLLSESRLYYFLIIIFCFLNNTRSHDSRRNSLKCFLIKISVQKLRRRKENMQNSMG